MAHVKLGKSTTEFVEFFAIDDEGKECGTIYYTIDAYNVIGDNPFTNEEKEKILDCARRIISANKIALM